MREISVSEAKTHLSQLLERVRAGEEVVILKSGKPYARLIPATRVERRQPGLLGVARVDDSFFEALPDAELAAWE